MTSPEQERSEPPEAALVASPDPEGAAEGASAEPEAQAPKAPPPKTPPPKAEASEPESEAASRTDSTSSTDASQDSTPAEGGGSPSERLPQPGRRAQPVTVTMLKAAARSPEDVKEIVRVESRLREKKRVEPASGEEAREGTGQDKALEKSSAPKPAAPSVKPGPQPPSPPEGNQSPAPKRPAPQSATLGQARAPKSPRADNPQARAPQPRAPRPEPTQAPAAESPPAAPASVPRPSAWPIAAAILVTGAALTWAIRSSQPTPQPGSATPALAAASPAPSAQVLPAPAATPSRRGTLASFGRDHVVYSDGSGELVVLKGDAVSGELTLERVYVVRRDRQRDLGDAARPLHGVYLDDLHLERSAELRAATLEFRTRLAEARRKGEGLEVLDTAAARLARAGGADLLIPLLEPTNPTLDRRAATIGLLESRYRCALPHVAELIRRYKDGPQGRRLCKLSGDLIGLPLDARAPEAAAEAIEAWCREHPLLDRFEQVAPTGADLPR